MPSRKEILKEITQAKSGAQDEIRRRYLRDLANLTGHDTILYSSAFTSSKTANIPSQFISITYEDIQGFMSALKGLKGERLDLIIHSPGGSLEVTEQLVNYLRGKYGYIRVIIPQNAMSAATMLACAADEIVMGKHSAIGPIDPQITIPTPSGTFVAPAQSILDEFEMAKEEIKKDPQTAPIWVRRIDQYPIGFLKKCRNSIELSQEIVKTWLTKWMFNGEPDSIDKAESIAKWLSATDTHKTHGRPIGIDEAREKGLKVIPLEQDNEFQDKVMSIFHATMVTHEVSNCVKIIENHNGDGAYWNVEIRRAQK